MTEPKGKLAAEAEKLNEALRMFVAEALAPLTRWYKALPRRTRVRLQSDIEDYWDREDRRAHRRRGPSVFSTYRKGGRRG